MMQNFISRTEGPLHFRFILQPLMATFFGIRDGVSDAKTGRPPYFWTICWNKEHREDFLKEGIRRVAKILILAIVLDAIYQLIELHWFYPGEAIIVAITLAFIPYLIIRGPANRIARWWFSRSSHPEVSPRKS
jgi:hypothetical protein